MRHDDAFLKDYLVSDVEDPRTHFPSILTRGMLAELRFPGKFRELIWQEYQFGISLSYIRRVFQQRPSAGTPRLLFDALKNGKDSFQSIPVPNYIHENWKQLESADPDLNYLAKALEPEDSESRTAILSEKVLQTFESKWRTELPAVIQDPLNVMEPACGSANDYRFLDSFGFGPLMRYRGFDICLKNISNARSCFPDIQFEEGSVFEINEGNGEVDYLFVHDLFEHLSILGMERGFEEVCRVTRGMACLCFFNMAERDDHLVQAKEGYHWNRLSLEKVLGFLEPRCNQLQVIHVAGFLSRAFGCEDYHNSGAYVLVLDFCKK